MSGSDVGCWYQALREGGGRGDPLASMGEPEKLKVRFNGESPADFGGGGGGGGMKESLREEHRLGAQIAHPSSETRMDE